MAAVEVDDRAAQNPVKPSRGILRLGGLLGRGQRIDQTLLHHVFRQVRIAHALAGKRHEGFQVRQQRGFNVLHGPYLSVPAGLRKAVTGFRENKV